MALAFSHHSGRYVDLVKSPPLRFACMPVPGLSRILYKLVKMLYEVGQGAISRDLPSKSTSYTMPARIRCARAHALLNILSKQSRESLDNSGVRKQERNYINTPYTTLTLLNTSKLSPSRNSYNPAHKAQ